MQTLTDIQALLKDHFFKMTTEDLVDYYDGPLLWFFRDAEQTWWMAHWHDITPDHKTEEYFVRPCSEQERKDFLDSKISYYDMLTKASKLYVARYSADGLEIRDVTEADLNPENLPDKDVYVE